MTQWTNTAERLDTAGNQVTLRQSLSPDKLDPGIYQIKVKVNDLVSQAVDFNVGKVRGQVKRGGRLGRFCHLI